jgi:predicted secreted acid phosphatase
MSKMSLLWTRDKIKKDARIEGVEDTMKIIFQVLH